MGGLPYFRHGKTSTLGECIYKFVDKIVDK